MVPTQKLVSGFRAVVVVVVVVVVLIPALKQLGVHQRVGGPIAYKFVCYSSVCPSVFLTGQLRSLHCLSA